MKPANAIYAPGTVGYHYRMAELLFGEGPALDYLAGVAARSPIGYDEPVLADESQVVALLSHLHFTGGDV